MAKPDALVTRPAIDLVIATAQTTHAFAVESVRNTIKARMGATHFLTKTLLWVA